MLFFGSLAGGVHEPQDGALFVAVRGKYVAKVNGREVARKRDWTTFDRQDVTDFLVVGENTIELTVTAPTPSPFGPDAGATTVPGDPAMNSYNRYAFGSVIAWVYRYVTGIDTSMNSPGFKKIVIRPHLDPRVTSARGEYDSIYGKIVTDWKGSADGPFSLKVIIPANTTADVFLPAGRHAQVTESGNTTKTQKQGEALVVSVGSGSYVFEVQ